MAMPSSNAAERGLDPEAYDVGYKDGFADGVARVQEMLKEKDAAYKGILQHRHQVPE